MSRASSPSSGIAPPGSALRRDRGLLILKTVGPDGEVEDETEIPVGHAHALLDVCAGEVDYTRTALPISEGHALVDEIIRPRVLHLVTVEFDFRGGGEGIPSAGVVWARGDGEILATPINPSR